MSLTMIMNIVDAIKQSNGLALITFIEIKDCRSFFPLLNTSWGPSFLLPNITQPFMNQSNKQTNEKLHPPKLFKFFFVRGCGYQCSQRYFVQYK